MSQFLDSILAVKNNYKPYDAWEQKEADDRAKREYLSKKLDLPKDKVELTREKAKSVFRAADMLDKRSEDNCADMEQTTGIISMIALAPLVALPMLYESVLNKKGKKPNIKVQVAMNILPFIPAIGLYLWGNAKQKEASRIGRFQAKQHELKDPKNFVIYTPKQINTANETAKNTPDKVVKKDFNQMLNNMKQVSIDKQEYKKWVETHAKASDEEIKKILNTEFNPQQIAQGEEDKEIIVNIIKDVNISAETYAENIENLFATLQLATFITQLPILFLTDKILSKVKNISPMIRNIAPVLAMTLPALAMLPISTVAKKEGSRVGRFVKRQEILDNPELIMAYSDDQLALAKDIKAPKLKQGFFDNLKANFKFFGQYAKDIKAYKKYKETTAKENEKLYDALGQAQVSEKQLKDAKNLQEKTFRAFEKMDEMSQRYSEDIEAAGEVGLELFSLVTSIVSIAPVILLGVVAKRGRILDLANTLSKIGLKPNSEIRLFIDKAAKTVSNNKELKSLFSNIISKDKNGNYPVMKNISNILKHPEVSKLINEFNTKNPQIIKEFENIPKSENIVKSAREFLEKHAKQDPISKWIRNLIADIIKLKFNSGEKLNKNLSALGNIKKFYKEYKTLCNSILLGGFAPILIFTAGLPALVSSWLTNLQLKAGKIGIMKAMEQIDNPKLFVNNCK